MIEAVKLCKRFGSVTAVDDVSLAVGDNERIAVLGESGSGKSTLLLLLAGLLSPDGGSVLKDGKPLDSPPHLRGMAMAFQEAALWNHMTVASNILFGCPERNKAAAKRLAEELAEELGIAGLLRRFPHEISGGQARRVSIARALACKRELLLLDEAFCNLDEETKRLAISTVRRRCEGRSAILLVTHDPAEAEALCEKRLYMAFGSLKSEGEYEK